MTHCWWWL